MRPQLEFVVSELNARKSPKRSIITAVCCLNGKEDKKESYHENEYKKIYPLRLVLIVLC
jgi:hypothetical protein